MQTLEERDTYTPTDTPQVCSNCDLTLNRDLTIQETDRGLSVLGSKTSSNSPMWTNSERKGQNLRVSVKSKFEAMRSWNTLW